MKKLQKIFSAAFLFQVIAFVEIGPFLQKIAPLCSWLRLVIDEAFIENQPKFVGGVQALG